MPSHHVSCCQSNTIRVTPSISQRFPFGPSLILRHEQVERHRMGMSSHQAPQAQGQGDASLVITAPWCSVLGRTTGTSRLRSRCRLAESSSRKGQQASQLKIPGICQAYPNIGRLCHGLRQLDMEGQTVPQLQEGPLRGLYVD